MAPGADLVWQPALLDAAVPALDVSFSRASRRTFDDRSWIDAVAAWVDGADALFADLLDLVGWRQREWDHAIPKVSSARPRLSITFRHSDPSPEQLAHETV